jgi:hypothetical protein
MSDGCALVRGDSCARSGEGCALVRGDSCARSGEHRFVLKGRGLGSEK